MIERNYNKKVYTKQKLKMCKVTFKAIFTTRGRLESLRSLMIVLTYK